MAGRRWIYLATLMACSIFYIAYGQWLSWILLLTVVGLPWFSLLLSLPAILRFRISPDGPAVLEPGGQGQLWLLGSCPFPMPPFRGRLKLKRMITGESWYYQEPGDLLTDHCGGIAITAEGVRVCDYLGLFSFPVPGRESRILLIRPRPVKMDPEKNIHCIAAQSWKPKSGGGYAENHELRLYRPGDSLNQVHWKLSAKTGDLILREPMEARQGLLLVTMNLRGTGDELDRKLGRLLWLGEKLLEQSLRFELRALTAEGILALHISDPAQLRRALDTLLCSRSAETGDLQQQQEHTALWHCHIGGGPDEI